MNNDVLVIAHRGFRGIAPENTLLAARLGHEAGAPCWELDVAASSDGELMLMHDDTLVRTTDARTRFPSREPFSIYDFTLSELKTLDAGSWYAAVDPFGQIAQGRLKPAQAAAFAGLRLPTLREALELTKALRCKVNIELKDATGRPCDAWLPEKAVALVDTLDMADAVLFSSFNHDYLARVKKAAARTAAGDVATAALIDRPIPDPAGLLRSLGALALNPNAVYLDKAAVEAVRTAGFGVLVWTVNEKVDMKRLIEWGVTGLITDFPDRALEVLSQN